MREQLGQVHSDAVRFVAQDYGGTMLDTGGILHEAGDTSDPYYADLVREKASSFELFAGMEAFLLYDAMYNMKGLDGLRQSGGVYDAIASSDSVVTGYGRLPALSKSEDTHSERTAILAILGAPEQWLQYDPVLLRAFSYTDFGQAELQRSYVPGRGCPMLSMQIEIGDSKENFFLDYWRRLLPTFAQIVGTPQAAKIKREAVDYVEGRRTVNSSKR